MATTKTTTLPEFIMVTRATAQTIMDDQTITKWSGRTSPPAIGEMTKGDDEPARARCRHRLQSDGRLARDRGSPARPTGLGGSARTATTATLSCSAQRSRLKSKEATTMFSVRQKREIAEKVQAILRETAHPELPAGEIQFLLHVDGAEPWSWADIRNNGAVPVPWMNRHNERMDTRKGDNDHD